MTKGAKLLKGCHGFMGLSLFHYREDCDKFALQTQQRWAAAQAAGAFKDEIAPIEIKTKKGVLVC